MKILLCLLSLGLVLAAPAGAHDGSHPRFIEVTGTAELHAEVDQVTWSIAIRGDGESLADASSELEERSAALKKSVEEAGFPEKTLRLSNITAGKDYEHGPEGRKFLGYYAQRSVQVQLEDLDQRQVLEAILLADDAIEIRRIQTKSSQHEALREQVLLAAVSAAKAKAEKLAAEAGVTLGELNYLKEGTPAVSGPVITSNRVMFAAADAGGIDSFDQIEYTASVVVSYGIQ